MIDMQERLAPAMCDWDGVFNRAGVLLRAAAALKLETVVSEQYPKGLGPTLPELAALLLKKTPVVPKTGFSVFMEPEFRKLLIGNPAETLIFFGIEAHVCVLQSVFDALREGYNTVLVADAVTSRRSFCRETALEAARREGALVVDTEAILFQLLRDAAHPAFKTISKLIR